MTKLKKNLILLILFLFFSSCGYTPIFSKKDVNFSIENIEFFGDRFVKKRINHTLSVYKNKSDKEKKNIISHHKLKKYKRCFKKL